MVAFVFQEGPWLFCGRDKAGSREMGRRAHLGQVQWEVEISRFVRILLE